MQGACRRAPPACHRPGRLPHCAVCFRYRSTCRSYGMNTPRGRWKGAWPSWLVARRPPGQRDGPGRPAGHAEPYALQAGTIPTFSGSRSRPRVRAWLALLVAVLVAVAAGYAISRVHAYAADRAELQGLLGQLDTATRHRSALEWQAIAEQRLSPALDEEQREVDAAADWLAAQLHVRDATSGQAKAVHDAFALYDAAVDQEFALLAKGQVGAAEQIDEQRVDPAFARLGGALAVAGRRYAALAALADRRAELGTWLILLAAAAVIGALAWRVQRARAQAAALFAYQARHDPLTALPNRALLVEQLDREPARDQLLGVVGERLRGCLRPGDLPARMGGDEFTVLLADLTGLPDAIQVAERLVAELGVPFEVAGHKVVVHASIGIAESVPGQTTAQELLRNADIAMYEAKKQGKGQHQLFIPGMDAPAWRRLELEAELHVALHQGGQFELYYQPIVDLDSGAVSELEALVRWDHPSRGLLPPADFIPLAEQTGLIVPLGAWVLDEACRQLAAWQPHDQHQQPLGLSVNLSARQLRDRHLPDLVAQALAASGLDPPRLTLEITETSMVEDLRAAGATLAAVRALGVRLAVARTLGLPVTGEGIETADQLQRLRALGCDRGQGYYFAKPLQHGSIQPFLDAHPPPPRPAADQQPQPARSRRGLAP